MAIVLWVSGAIPLAVTGLLILAALPLFGAMSPAEAFPLFGNPAVFFILGALVLAAALMTTGLSRRVSLFLLLRFGGSARRLATGILLTCALLSCVMPEHAVAAIVFPTVSTISRALGLEPRKSRLAPLLYLSMAWGCIAGGIATLLGGARAALAIGILKETTGRDLDFVGYSAAALPVALVLVGVAVVVLNLFYKPEVDDVTPARVQLEREIQRSGAVEPQRDQDGGGDGAVDHRLGGAGSFGGAGDAVAPVRGGAVRAGRGQLERDRAGGELGRVPAVRRRHRDGQRADAHGRDEVARGAGARRTAGFALAGAGGAGRADAGLDGVHQQRRGSSGAAAARAERDAALRARPRAGDGGGRGAGGARLHAARRRAAERDCVLVGVLRGAAGGAARRDHDAGFFRRVSWLRLGCCGRICHGSDRWSSDAS